MSNTKKNVFLTWGGQRSKAVAAVFNDMLPCFIHSVRPFFSDDHIGAGERWRQVLADELANQLTCITFITGDAHNRPWVNYEAGAISRDVDKSRVVPLFFDVHPADLDSGHPLLQFNAVRFLKDDVLGLVQSINQQMEAPTTDAALEQSFDSFWPQLESRVDEIISKPQGDGVPTSAPASDPKDEMLAEILLLARELHRDQPTKQVHIGNSSDSDPRQRRRLVFRQLASQVRELGDIYGWDLVAHWLTLSGYSVTGSELREIAWRRLRLSREKQSELGEAIDWVAARLESEVVRREGHEDLEEPESPVGTDADLD